MTNPQIQSLANWMREKKKQGGKVVLMLGAGASMSSGVKSTPTIMGELLTRFRAELTEGTLEERFDEFWRSSTDDDREMYLAPYLDVTPSSGYRKLAEMIRAGYFDVVLTFNFDDLLEKALRAAGCAEGEFFKVIRRGEVEESRLRRLLDATTPPVKIFKLHGSVRSSQEFLFSSAEMMRYPETIETLVGGITERDIFVIGYAFNDECMRRAFSQDGGGVVSVDPGGVPRDLAPIMRGRRSDKRSFKMKFDAFCEALSEELAGAAQPAESVPTRNYFKFLESYTEADSSSLMLRDREISQFMEQFDTPPFPQAIILGGPARTGKTSLVRAGLIPAVRAAGLEAIYMRCASRDYSAAGGSELIRLPQKSAATEATPRGTPHTVVFLDQFDRVTSSFKDSDPAWRSARQRFLRECVFTHAADERTLVLVISEEPGLGLQLMGECSQAGLRTSSAVCDALGKAQVVQMINGLATKGGIQFEPDLVENLASRYVQYRESADLYSRFTLSHVQAVCHLLARSNHVDDASFRALEMEKLAALNQAVNYCDFLNFVEDFDWPDSAWLRNMLRVFLGEEKDQIAKFIKDHWDEVIPQGNRPVRSEKTEPALQPA